MTVVNTDTLANPALSRVVCYSGGHSSALVAIEVARKYGVAKTILLNHDITEKSESADIKRFKREVAAYLGIPITYANMDGWDEQDQFDVVVNAGAFKVGNGTALCTSRMKTRPFEAWLAETFPAKDAVIYYGFDANESARIQRRWAHLGTLGFKTDFPLALWKTRTIQSTKEIGVLPPLHYDSYKHGNCKGCLRAGRQHWYVTYCLEPEIFARGKWAESEIGYTIIKGASLEELEPLFARMKAAGVPATEHIPPSRFWADVKRLLKNETVTEDAAAVPCECAA